MFNNYLNNYNLYISCVKHKSFEYKKYLILIRIENYKDAYYYFVKYLFIIFVQCLIDVFIKLQKNSIYLLFHAPFHFIELYRLLVICIILVELTDG